MLNEKQRGVIALLRSALTGQAEILPQGFSMEQVMPEIRGQHLSVIAYCGAVTCGISPETPAVQELLSDVGKHISISEGQMTELKMLEDAFEAAGVDYMLLKGAVMKSLYPRPEMRAMSDADILIRVEQQELIAETMKKLGFEKGIESDHELNWTKPSLHVELHKRPMPSYNKRFYAYYGNGWDRGKPSKDAKHRYEMSWEDFFIFLFSHFTKHFRDGGIGLLQLCDLQLYRDKCSMNEAYILKEMKKLHLDVFYKNVMEALNVVFCGAEEQDAADVILQVIFSSGAYGTKQQQRISWAVRHTEKTDGVKKVKRRMLLELVFLPYWRMCLKYPFLRKLPFLLPIMWVVRWIDTLLFRRKKIRQETELLRRMTPEEISEYQCRLSYVGLELNKKE